MKNSLRLIAPVALGSAAILFSSCTSIPIRQNSGSFAFDPPAKKPGNPSAVKVRISTGAQRLYVTEGSEVLLATPVSVGKSATPTPKGNFRINSKTRHRRRQSNPGAGYPMTYWMSFYSPSYGMHWGFVKPYPCTAGCVRLPLKSAKKVYDMVRVGTPVNVARSQPWDATVGASLPRLDDTSLPDPPPSYMKGSQVFADQEKGKMWNY